MLNIWNKSWRRKIWTATKLKATKCQNVLENAIGESLWLHDGESSLPWICSTLFDVIFRREVFDNSSQRYGMSELLPRDVLRQIYTKVIQICSSRQWRQMKGKNLRKITQKWKLLPTRLEIELIGAACWFHNLRKAFQARNHHQWSSLERFSSTSHLGEELPGNCFDRNRFLEDWPQVTSELDRVEYDDDVRGCLSFRSTSTLHILKRNTAHNQTRLSKLCHEGWCSTELTDFVIVCGNTLSSQSVCRRKAV